MNHPNNEWSLIIFNILGDLSVGVFIALGIAHFYAVRKAGLKQADQLSTRALLILGPVLVLGMLAVFGHVGNPERVFNMLSNLDTSWLAREVAAYGAFLVIGGVFAVLQAVSLLSPERQERLPQWLRNITPRLRILLAWIAALFGVLFVLSAAMIYYDPRLAARQTGWAHVYTPILFFVDSGLLGALALAIGFIGNYIWIQRRGAVDQETLTVQLSLLKDCIQGMAFASIALVGILFLIIPIYLVYLASGESELNQAILQMLYTDYAAFWFMRLFLVFTGAGVLAGSVWYTANQEKRERLMYLLVTVAFVCVVAAEVIARYLFYGRNATLLVSGV
jgi:DMSO reductase anchor subunit